MALEVGLSSHAGVHRLGFQFDISPERKEHWKIRQEGLLKMETHEVCAMDDKPLTAQQLKYEVTPPKKRLMIIPKKGQGSKMALYANYGTGPLLVTVDLLDTLLQRLTHRVHVLLWQHCQLFGRDGGYALEDLVIKIKSLSVRASAIRDGNIQHVTYQGLVRVLVGEDKGEEDEVESDFSEDEEVDHFCDEGFKGGLQEDGEDLDLKTLLNQYRAAKQEVENGTTLEKITITWLDSLLQLSECGLLIRSLQSPSDYVVMSTTSLRSALMAFVKSKTKTERIEASHLFGSLLSRDFLSETLHATRVEEDVDLNSNKVDETPNFFLPQRPSGTLTMEQPLYAPKAFSCNWSRLEDRETILDDIWEDRERSLRSLQEDVSKAPELLTIAMTFWRKQVMDLKQKRKRKNEKAKARKKPRLQQ